MNRVAILAILLAGRSTIAHAQKASTTGPLQFQDVVTVEGATRGQIYDAALVWFSEAFKGDRSVLERNELAHTLIGIGVETYSPVFTSNSCGGSLRYRVLVAAKDGHYYYTIDGFTHEASKACHKSGLSFGVLTADWLSARAGRTVLDLTLTAPRREGDGMEVWADLKEKATTLGERLAKSLRARLAKAAAEKNRATSSLRRES